MTTHPSVVSRDDAITTTARVMRDRGIGVLPVIDDLYVRQLVGVITDHGVVQPQSAEAVR